MTTKESFLLLSSYYLLSSWCTGFLHPMPNSNSGWRHLQAILHRKGPVLPLLTYLDDRSIVWDEDPATPQVTSPGSQVTCWHQHLLLGQLIAGEGLLLGRLVETAWWRRAATWTVGGDDLLVGGGRVRCGYAWTVDGVRLAEAGLLLGQLVTTGCHRAAARTVGDDWLRRAAEGRLSSSPRRF